jgi:hypothetical protein
MSIMPKFGATLAILAFASAASYAQQGPSVTTQYPDYRALHEKRAAEREANRKADEEARARAAQAAEEARAKEKADFAKRQAEIEARAAVEKQRLDEALRALAAEEALKRLELERRNAEQKVQQAKQARSDTQPKVGDQVFLARETESCWDLENMQEAERIRAQKGEAAASAFFDTHRTRGRRSVDEHYFDDICLPSHAKERHTVLKVQASLQGNTPLYCLQITFPLDVRSPEEVAKTKDDKPRTDCWWVGSDAEFVSSPYR